MEPLVSVIITNYNYEKYLGEAINSVLNQTFDNFEIIIVDDGSTDDSRKIIKKYELEYPNKVKAIFKENGGQGSAFNAGFKIAKGKIVAFLDADDYWYPNKLKKIVKYHNEHDGIQHNLLINNQVKFTNLEDKVSKQKYGLEKYGFLGTIPTSGLSFKKKFLEDIFPVPEKDYRICADLYIKIMFLNKNDIFSLNTPLGFYRAHDSNQWFNSKQYSLKYNELTLKKVNELRKKEGKQLIIKESEAEAIGLFILESLPLNESERYVLYGTGKLSSTMYQKLRTEYNIVYFSNSFAKNNIEKFMDKPIKTVEYLKRNMNEFDKIIIASTDMVNITNFLLENGFENEKLLIPCL